RDWLVGSFFSFPLLNSDSKRSGVHGNLGRILTPSCWLHVDVDLDLVAVRIQEVHAVSNSMIGHSDDGHVGFAQTRNRRAQHIVALPYCQSKMVEAHAWLGRNRRGFMTDLDQQKFMVGAAG